MSGCAPTFSINDWEVVVIPLEFKGKSASQEGQLPSRSTHWSEESLIWVFQGAAFVFEPMVLVLVTVNCCPEDAVPVWSYVSKVLSTDSEKLTGGMPRLFRLCLFPPVKDIHEPLYFIGRLTVPVSSAVTCSVSWVISLGMAKRATVTASPSARLSPPGKEEEIRELASVRVGVATQEPPS